MATQLAWSVIEQALCMNGQSGPGAGLSMAIPRPGPIHPDPGGVGVENFIEPLEKPLCAGEKGPICSLAQ